MLPWLRTISCVKTCKFCINSYKVIKSTLTIELNQRYLVRNVFDNIGEGMFFLKGGEGWAILVFFTPKNVGPPLCFN